MNKLYFDISEFNISGRPVPEDIADKILRYHIWVLNPIREKYNMPIFLDKRSGYRNYDWEIAHKRDGTSTHTFTDRGIEDQGKGACDIAGADMKELFKLLAVMSPYSRICYYPNMNFFHVDYKYEYRGRTYHIDYSDGKGWQKVETMPELLTLIK